MRIERFLEAVIERHGLKNDTQLASMIGVRQSAVSQYRTGLRTPDNEACLRIAQTLQMDDPVPVIMAADIDRAERTGQRSLWDVFSKRATEEARVVNLVVPLASVTDSGTPSASQANSGATSSVASILLPSADAAGAVTRCEESKHMDLIRMVAGRRDPMFGVPDAVQALDQALRGGANERLPPLKRLANKIRDVNPSPQSPAREVLVLFGDRWSSLLMAVLATGCYRHAELHRIMNIVSRLSQESDISQRMLTLRLRALERDGLVSRSVGEGNAPAVEYRLTPLGASLVEKLEALVDWATDHADTILQAQQAFDERDAVPIGILRHRLR